MLLARAPTVEASRPSPSNHRASTGDAEDPEQEPRSPSVPPTTTSSNGSPMNSYFSDSDKAFGAVRRGSQAQHSTDISTAQDAASSGATDPLTLQILRRTNTVSKLRVGVDEDASDAAGNSGLGAPTKSSSVLRTSMSGGGTGKEKKKGVSFLSRIMGGKKKGDMDDDADAVDGDRRTEGMDAHVFSQPIGYTPTHPAPPKYIRVSSHHQPVRDFNQTFLAQELYRGPKIDEDAESSVPEGVNGSLVSLPQHKSGAIWAMKFSKDGKYLAAAGQDKVVRIWEVLSSKEERREHEKEEDAAGAADGRNPNDPGVRLNAPVFRSEPIQEYTGHTGDVLDLSWSKNNFLLSSSMDKTVRLWHVSRLECLCSFQHSDFVTSISFHPRDDRFFLAGSLDSKLRLWSIPDKSVAYWAELPDLITAVAFTPDGRMAIAGCLNGLCLFYETEGLRYHTQLHVRSSHGRNAKGSKITGIETATTPADDPAGDTKILITSNDSRVRLYNARDKSLETKFKGNSNASSQIHATFSDDGKYIICGSEDRRVYIWPTGPVSSSKRPVESFSAHPAIVTVAIIAPTATKQLLGISGDPLYDLCNPPPVTLVPSSTTPPLSPTIKPTDKPSWVAKSSHPDGNLIVSADYTGRIKVFRQDCAARRRTDSWDNGSTFSRKLTHTTTGLLRKTSTRSHGDSRSRSSVDSTSPANAPLLRAHGHMVQNLNRLSVRSLAEIRAAAVAGGGSGRSSTSGKKGLETRSEDEEDDEEESDGLEGLEGLGLAGFSSESEGEAVRCRGCKGTNFKAKVGRGGGKRLVCVKCNTVQA